MLSGGNKNFIQKKRENKLSYVLWIYLKTKFSANLWHLIYTNFLLLSAIWDTFANIFMLNIKNVPVLHILKVLFGTNLMSNFRAKWIKGSC